jgi:hypothetical protein
MAGWIKIHRDITNHWIFQDAEKFKWWIDMILLASHEEKKTLVGGKLVDFKRGQIIASLSFFSKRWGRSKEKVLNFLKLLESDQMIDRCTDQKISIITICKYEDYQKVEDQQPTDVPTDNKTDVRPMSDRCSTETKNVEECKRNNNTYSAHAREGIVTWNADTEKGYASTFISQGSAIPFAKRVGKTPQEVVKLLEVYMADRELKNKGHKDYNEFVNLFLWHVNNKKIALPAEEQKPKERKVISGSDILKIYGEN